MMCQLELGDRTLVTTFLRRYPPETSEMTFTNLFVWRGSRRVYLAEVQDSLLFIVESQEGGETRKVILGCPVGDVSAHDVIGIPGLEVEGFVRVPRGTAETLRSAGLNIEPDRDSWDYVYRVEDMAELAGRRFHKKRNLVRRCLEAQPCEYEQITGRILDECMDMQDRWCRARNCGQEPGLCSEYIAVREMFAHYEEFHLVGGAVRIGGKIEAYAVGEELSPGTAVCHFEKAMPGIEGLGQVINQWFARYSVRDFEFLNREQDLGIPGLRQAKKSYYPHHMVEKFNAFFAKGVILPPLAVEPHECEKYFGR